MIDKLTARRDSLKQELARALDLMAKKNAEIEELNKTMLRISGAIQVLEEAIEEMRLENPGQQPG